MSRLSRGEKQKRDPQERVDNMNSIFDRIVLPMLIFTVVMFVVLGVTQKCSGSSEDSARHPQADAVQTSPFDRRERLLDDIDANADLFEAAGYTLIDNGDTVAYRKLDSGAEIFENMKDSNGYRVSIITFEAEGRSIVISVYSENIFLVSVKSETASASAIFDNTAFSEAASPSDRDRAEVLKLAESRELSELLEQYLASIPKVEK